MGFNRRKLEDQRREAANKEAAKRRATDAQVLEDAEPPDRRLERAPGVARADDLFANDRCHHRRRLLVPVGALMAWRAFQAAIRRSASSITWASVARRAAASFSAASRR